MIEGAGRHLSPAPATSKMQEASPQTVSKDTKGECERRALTAAKPDASLEDALPAALYSALMPFQREGIRYCISRGGRCMIGDDMGLGKTLQAIAIAAMYTEDWPVLVLMPASMRWAWADELEKWLPTLRPGDVKVVKAGSDTDSLSTSKFILCTYDLFQRSDSLRAAIAATSPGILIADESHYLKNKQAKRTQAVSDSSRICRRVILLSGTPALNRPVELFPQINMISNVLGSWTEYTKQHCGAKKGRFGWEYRGAENLPELHKKLQRVMIRRLKKDVLDQLPAKTRQQIPLELEASVLKGLKTDSERMRMIGDGFERNALWQDLTQRTAMAKLPAAGDYVLDLVEGGAKMLVFGHYMALLDGIEQRLARHKVGYIRIDGSVSGLDRRNAVNTFQEDPECRVALLGMLAAGQGITLTAADTVVFAELNVTPGILAQCEDRAHRIGQLNAINVHYLVAKSTVDEAIWKMVTRKLGVVGMALDGERSKLSAEMGEGISAAADGQVGGAPPAEFFDLCTGAVAAGARAQGIKAFFSPPGAAKGGPGVGSSNTSSKAQVTSLLEGNRLGKNGGKGSQSFFAPQGAGARSERSHSSDVGAVDGVSASDEGYEGMEWALRESLRHAELEGVCIDLDEEGELDDANKARQPATNEIWVECIDSDIEFENDGSQHGCSSQSQMERKVSGGAASSSSSGIEVTVDLTQGDSELSPSEPTRHQAKESDGRRDAGRAHASPQHSSNGASADVDSVVSSRGSSATPKSASDLWFSVSANTQRIYVMTDKCGEECLGHFMPSEASSAASLPRWLDRASRGRETVLRFVKEWEKLRAVHKKSLSDKVVSMPLSREVARLESHASGSGSTKRHNAELRFDPAEGVCGWCGNSLGKEDETSRFCSHLCKEAYQACASSSAVRRQLYELERGVCQLCQVDAHALYVRVKALPRGPERMQALMESNIKLKGRMDKMIKAPVEGDFWQADHIRPVCLGGGQVDISGLRTLCTPCHEGVTRDMMSGLKRAKLGDVAKGSADIRSFFGGKS